MRQFVSRETFLYTYLRLISKICDKVFHVKHFDTYPTTECFTNCFTPLKTLHFVSRETLYLVLQPFPVTLFGKLTP